MDQDKLKMETLYTINKKKLGAECGSDRHLLIAKFRLKLKKIGSTTRPFRCGLNKIPYDYTVGVMNRIKGLYLFRRVPEELWTKIHYIVQESVTKTFPKKNKCKKTKWLSEEVLHITEVRRQQRTREKGKM